MKAKKQTAKRKPNHLDRAAAKIAMSARASWGSLGKGIGPSVAALVRRAVREAYSGGFDCGRNDCRGSCAVRDRLNTKYGAKLS